MKLINIHVTVRRYIDKVTWWIIIENVHCFDEFIIPLSGIFVA